MKTKLKRISKSALSVILALMMVISTMAIGIVTTSATNDTIKVYFKDTVGWGSVYAYFYNGTYWSNTQGSGSYNIAGGPVEMTLVSGTADIYSCTYNGDYSQYISFTKDEQKNYNNFSNTKAAYRGDFNVSTPLYTPDTTATGTYNNDTVTYYNNGSWSTYGGSSGGGDDPITVTDPDLLSVLKGETVMFYGGEPDNWDNISNFYVMTENDIGKSIASGSISSNAEKLSTTNDSYKFATLCAPVGTYYLGHWNSGLSTKISAGGTYVIRKSTIDTNGYVQCSFNNNADDPNYLYSFNNGATLTATTTCASEIKRGTSLTVNTSPSSAGTSTIGKNNSFEYYIGNSSDNYSKYSLSGGSIDTSSLADGTYTLKTVLTDGNIYVVADTDNFTVSAATEPTTTQPVQSKFYIIGHQFPADNSNDTWTINNKKYEMKYDAENAYYYYVKDFSTWNGSDNNFFRFHNGTDEYGPSDDGTEIEDNKTQHGYTKNKTAYNYVGNADEVKICLNPTNNQVWIEPQSAATYYSVSAVSGGNGTVGLSAESVREGNSVTLTATPATGYDFDKWTINGNYSDTALDLNSATLTLTPTSNITATASFKKSTGTETNLKLLVSGTSNNPSTMSDSKAVVSKIGEEDDAAKSPIYQVTLDVRSYQKSHDYYVALSATDSYTKMYWQGEKNKDKVPAYVASDSSLILSAAAQDYFLNDTNTRYNFARFQIKYDVENITEVTIVINTRYKSYTFSSNGSHEVPETTYDIYAKNGTPGTKDFGTTTLTAGYNSSTAYSYYKVYKAKEGTKLTVQTVVNSTAAEQGYYVYAFCVDGVKYDVTQTANNTYQNSTPIVVGKKDIEITPIYYNSNIDAAGDYVTLYIDPTTLVDPTTNVNHWGSSIYIYSYYYKNPNNTSTDTSAYVGDGTYPGQPMVLDASGYYVAKISKLAYENGAKVGGDNTSENREISGITINNGYENESAHQHFLTQEQKKNYQSYDYDDFKLIAKAGYDTARFDVKYYNYENSHQYKLIGNATNSPDPSGNLNYSDYSNWEQLTNFDKKPVSIIGYTDDTVPKDKGSKLDTSAPLRIVSVGNQTTTMGVWSTIWYVYKNDGTFVTKGLPSDFIPRTQLQENGTYTELPVERQTSAYQAIVNANVQYNTAEITYEKEMDATTSSAQNTGVRLDGRWYYTRSTGANIKVNVGILYGDNSETPSWTVDADGSVTNATATIDGVTRKTFDVRNTQAQLVATNGNGYYFAGWTKKNSDGTYTDLPIKTMSGSITVSTDIDIYAKYLPVASGTLQLTHSMYTGKDANLGAGTFYVQAVLKDGRDNVQETYNINEGSLSIPNLTSEMAQNGYTIEVTLSTVSFGQNKFNSFYIPGESGLVQVFDENHTGSVATDISPATYALTVNVKDLFTNVDGIWTQTTKSISYYSDLTKTSVFCNITYKYKERFDSKDIVTYTVKDIPLSDTEIADSYIPSDATIQKYAPYVDTIYVDTNWKLENCTFTKSSSYATVTAKQTPKNCTLYYPELDTDGSLKVTYTSKIQAFNEWAGEGTQGVAETFTFAAVAPQKDSDGKTFSYWEVYEANASGLKTDKLVTRYYNREFGLRMYDDYYLVPKYGVTRDNVNAEISDPVLNREIKGDSANPTDRVYADLLVAYNSTVVPVFREANPEDFEIVCGVVIDRNNDVKLSDEDYNAIKSAAKNNQENPGFTALPNSDRTAVENVIDAGTTGNSTYTDSLGNEHRLTNSTIDVSKLTNKNRIDKVMTYTNNEANQRYIFVAYSYVVIKNKNTGDTYTAISNGVTYNFCYVGNKVPSETLSS